MNNKGFTLTELLVTIALIGIISGIAFPAISNLQTENKEKSYKEYEKILKNGAKLYAESNSATWSLNSNNKIKFNDLKNYIKAYNQNGVKCDDSYVCVKKDGNSNLIYTPIAICKKGTTDVYKTTSSITCN